MVKLSLRWSREHSQNFLETLQKRLKDSKSEYFNINLYLDGCNISIDRGEINQ